MDHQQVAPRLASRFAAKLPSTLGLGFLTKAAKGLKGGFSIEALEEALPLLGWSLQTQRIAVPLKGDQLGWILYKNHGLPTKERSLGGDIKGEGIALLTNSSEESATLVTLVAKHVESVGASGPSSPVLGTVYIHDLAAGHYGQRNAVQIQKAWLGMQGWTIITPKGAVVFTNKISHSGRIEEFTDAAPEKVWTHLYKSGLKEAATALLSSFGTEVVQQALKPVDPRTLEGTGTCPACFKNTKLLRDQKVMRHGWELKGKRQRGALNQSWHLGQCFGVGYQPYELSPEGTKDFLEKVVKPHLAELKRQLAHLQSRPATIRIRKDDRDEFEVIPRDTTERRYNYAIGAYVSKYDYYLEQQIEQIERSVKGTKEEADMLTLRVSRWKLLPLPGKQAP